MSWASPEGAKDGGFAAFLCTGDHDKGLAVCVEVVAHDSTRAAQDETNVAKVTCGEGHVLSGTRYGQAHRCAGLPESLVEMERPQIEAELPTEPEEEVEHAIGGLGGRIDAVVTKTGQRTGAVLVTLGDPVRVDALPAEESEKVAPRPPDAYWLAEHIVGALTGVVEVGRVQLGPGRPAAEMVLDDWLNCHRLLLGQRGDQQLLRPPEPPHHRPPPTTDLRVRQDRT
jgi:hypothetical protein